MNLEELKQFRPSLTKQADYDAFWDETLDESRRFPLDAEWVPVDYPVKGIKVYSLSYSGYKGSRVNAWYILPEKATPQSPVPAILHFSGYTWAKGFVGQYMAWALQGYAVLAMDNRGQGGITPEYGDYTEGSVPGWLTKGINDKYRYYYRSVFVDGVRAIDFLSSIPEINASKIGILGGSQGGGIGLAVAGLDSRPAFMLSTFPFLCNFEKAFELCVTSPYSELVEYFKMFDPEMKKRDEVFKTLSYFDGMNFASRVKCPVLMAIGLKDTVCNPVTTFSAFNHLQGEKELVVYPLHGHEALYSHDDLEFLFAAKYSGL